MIFPNNPKSFVEKEHNTIAFGRLADMQSAKKKKSYMQTSSLVHKLTSNTCVAAVSNTCVAAV